jgi:50S ribosomal subunit-associated GTPase HflX
VAAARSYGTDAGGVQAQARVEVPADDLSSSDARCRDRSRGRGSAGAGRHRERADVRTLAARVADLERRLSELRRGG